MRRPNRSMTPPRRAQQGAVAVMFALTLAVILGFAGLALDGGRLYVNKAELQNAADACALAAAQELTPGAVLLPADFTRAQAAAVTVAARNSSDFQSQPLAAGSVTVEFALGPSGPLWSGTLGALPTYYFARCTVAPAALRLWLMPLLGIDSAQVSAVAAASRALDAPGPPNCARGPGACTVRPSLVQ